MTSSKYVINVFNKNNYIVVYSFWFFHAFNKFLMLFIPTWYKNRSLISLTLSFSLSLSNIFFVIRYTQPCNFLFFFFCNWIFLSAHKKSWSEILTEYNLIEQPHQAAIKLFCDRKKEGKKKNLESMTYILKARNPLFYYL